jgi:creatinine deaminase
MCTGACILYKIKRVVMGENKNFVGGEKYLRERGVEVVNLSSRECEKMMGEFIEERPGDW